MQTVHGDRQCLVRLLGDGTVGHCPRLKTRHDGIDTLDLLERHALFRVIEIHQTAERDLSLFLIHKLRVLFKEFVVAALCRFLKQMNRRRIVEMRICAASHLVASSAVQCEIRL